MPEWKLEASLLDHCVFAYRSICSDAQDTPRDIQRLKQTLPETQSTHCRNATTQPATDCHAAKAIPAQNESEKYEDEGQTCRDGNRVRVQHARSRGEKPSGFEGQKGFQI